MIITLKIILGIVAIIGIFISYFIIRVLIDWIKTQKEYEEVKE